MTHQALIDQWYGALRTGDTAKIAAIVTSDVKLWWGNSQRDLVPWCGTHEGVEAVQAFAKTYAGHVATRQIDIKDTVQAGDKLFVTFVGRWTVPISQLDLMARQLDVFTIRDGKIAGCESFPDTVGFTMVLGRFRR